MRTFGIELELGDVPTVDLAEQVYLMQGLNPNDWRDRGRNTKIREYDFWNVQSDPTIRNTDGSLCMYTVVDREEIVKLTKENKDLQCGAEIISPVCIDVDQNIQSLEHILQIAEKHGAVVDPKLDHGIHVHVGIEDYDIEDIKSLMTWHFEHGDEFFGQFPGYKDRKSRRKNYWQWLIDDLQGLTTAEEVWELYKTKSSTGSTSDNEFVYRKDVNPAHWFENKVEGLDRPLTVEYRAFGSTTDVSLVKEIVNACLEITEAVKEKK